MTTETATETPIQTIDQAAGAAEDAAGEAVRLTLAAYAERARGASEEALEQLELVRSLTGKVNDADGFWNLREAEYAAHSASLLALEANVLARLHRRFSDRYNGDEGLHLFNHVDEETANMLDERDSIANLWERLDNG